MYFARGWPKVFVNELSEEGERIIAVERQWNSNKLLVATNQHIYIWMTGRSTVLLGRSPHPVSNSEFITAVWIKDRPDHVCALNGLGQIYIYSVTETRSACYPNTAGTAPTNSLPHLGKIHSHSVRISYFSDIPPIVGTSLVSCPPYLVVGTEEGTLSFYRNDGQKEPQGDFSVLNQLLEPKPACLPPSKLVDEEKSSAIVQILSVGGLLGFVFRDGNAAILYTTAQRSSIKEKEKISLSSLRAISNQTDGTLSRGEWLVQAGATQMAFSLRHQLLAVGHQSGEVSLFQSVHAESDHYHQETWGASDSDAPAPSFDILRILSLANWHIPPTQTGAVRHLTWSDDANVLAVGWKNRGISVWSIFGCRLMCSIPHLAEEVTSNSTCPNSDCVEPYRTGCSALAWKQGGYGLIGVEQSQQSTGTLLDIPFIRNPMVNCPSLHYTKHFILHGPDRLYLLDKQISRYGTPQGLGSANHSLLQVHVPSLYLNDNWPIHHVAASRNSEFLSVAGKHGAVIYDVKRSRWRMFGDNRQEKQIKTMHMSWCGNCLLLVNDTGAAKGRYEILAFPHDHLAMNSVLLKMKLPDGCTPKAMDCNDRHVLIAMSNSFVYLYRVDFVHSATEPETLTSMKLTLLHRKSSTSMHESLSLMLLPVSRSAPDDLNCLLLDRSGRSSCIDLSTSEDSEIGNSFESFWYSASSEDQTAGTLEPQHTLWCYGESGMQVTFPFHGRMGTRDSNQERSYDTICTAPSLLFDSDVSPIGCNNQQALIIGLSQVTSVSLASSFPYYDTMIRPQPFLHILLGHLLSNHQMEAAEQLARSTSTLDHFEHSLELLLHETVENQTHNLPQVISFLQKFAVFPLIVGRCARKTDVSHWKLLFQHTGAPMDLFAMSLGRDFVDSSVPFLRIIQIIHGKEEARQAGIMLLEAVLEHDILSILPDLLHFLDMDRNDDETSDSILTSSVDDDTLRDLVMGRYARRLILQCDLTKFLIFVSKSKTSPTFWMKRERHRAAEIEDFCVAIDAVHSQFDVIYPDPVPTISVSSGSDTVVLTPRRRSQQEHSPVRDYYPQILEQSESASPVQSPMKLERKNSDSPHREDQSPRLKTSTTGITFVLKRTDSSPQAQIAPDNWEHLETLLLNFYDSQCYHWCIVLASVMMNIPLLVHLLQTIPPLRAQFFQQMEHHPAPYYHALLAFLMEELNLM